MKRLFGDDEFECFAGGGAEMWIEPRFGRDNGPRMRLGFLCSNFESARIPWVAGKFVAVKFYTNSTSEAGLRREIPRCFVGRAYNAVSWKVESWRTM